MSKWRFNLRQSKDLSLIGELNQASGKSLALAHNNPGSSNWDYPMNGDWASVIQPFNTCISAERYNWRATLAMHNGGIPGEAWDWIWSGNVQTIDEDWTSNIMKVACVGWAQRLAMRMLHTDKTYSVSDDAPIIQDLLATANAATITNPDSSTYAVPTVAGSSPATPTWMAWGGTLPNEGAGGATAYVARTGITMVKTKYQMILPIFDEITGFENGLDWWVDPKTRLLYVYRKHCTSRSNVIVAFKWGPNNLAQFGRNIAGDQKANYVLVTGASGISAMADNKPDQASNGLIESLTQWTDATDTSVLLAEAGAQVIMRANGKITYGITPFLYAGDIGAPPTSVPEPFVDYNPVGDEFKLTAVHPQRGNIMLQTVRSFGVTVNIDEEGNEQLGQLQVAP
jgi:hypothetical protein